MKTEQIKPRMTYFCCREFMNNKYIFNWFKTEDSRFYCLPFIQENNNKLKAMFCPFCGTSIHGIMITRKDWEK